MLLRRFQKRNARFMTSQFNHYWKTRRPETYLGRKSAGKEIDLEGTSKWAAITLKEFSVYDYLTTRLNLEDQAAFLEPQKKKIMREVICAYCPEVSVDSGQNTYYEKPSLRGLCFKYVYN